VLPRKTRTNELAIVPVKSCRLEGVGVMSALGHKQTYALQRAKSGHCGLFDHLVGAANDCVWNVYAESLSRPEVDDQLDFCGLLDW
jgi:hypothetical protein